MKIIVAYKWAQNPQDAVVRDDGTIDWSRAPYAISEYDPVAIEFGRRLADSQSCELVGISVGGPEAAAPAATKAVLARGADRLVLVAHESLRSCGPTRTGSFLASIVGRLGDVALLLTGDSSVDNNAHVVPGVIAGFLGWNCLSAVTEASVGEGRARVTRRAGSGDEVVTTSSPLVLATATDACKPRTPGMKDMLAARNKPVEVLSPVDLPGGAELSRMSVRGTGVPVRRHRGREVVARSDAADAARILAVWLESAGVLPKPTVRGPAS